MTTLEKIKLSLRISHSKLDPDLQDEIAACLADLTASGVTYAKEEAPLVLNAIKLWCKAMYTDDPVKGAEYRRRYELLKGGLVCMEGYGWRDGDE